MSIHTDANLNDLGFLIGQWTTEGEVHAEDDAPSFTFRGTDTYEYVLDQKFILHTVDVMMGNQHVKALEMIHNDKNTQGTFILTSFDNSGTISTMAAQLNEEGKLIMAGNKMRAVLTRSEPNKMTGDWEKSEDNVNWQSWMNVILTR
jgi:hypothetical protein